MKMSESWSALAAEACNLPKRGPRADFYTKQRRSHKTVAIIIRLALIGGGGGAAAAGAAAIIELYRNERRSMHFPWKLNLALSCERDYSARWVMDGLIPSR